MLDIIINPFIAILLFLYRLLGGNVVLSLIVFTVLVRLAIYPLTAKSQRSTKAMQVLQPELKKLQEKYKNDREKLAQAQWELYRQHGFNPLAGCLPVLIQLPIWMALYRAIVITLAATPYQLLDLARRLWVPGLSDVVPLHNKFLWLNLATPDPLYVLPVLVVFTTWLQQKLIMPAAAPSSSSGDRSADQAAQVSRQMMIIMPFMFGFFALTFASGLSIYFIVSNLIGIAQYALTGKINLRQVLGRPAPVAAQPALAEKTKRDAEPASELKPKRTLDAAPEKLKRGVASLPSTPAARRAGVYDSRAERAKAKSKAKG